MGLLDDLKKKTEEKKATEEQVALSQQELEQHYQDEIHPLMLDVYKYFNELIEHLNFLEQPSIAQYPFLPGNEKTGLEQKNYKLVIDSTQTTKNVMLNFECHFPDPLEVEVNGKEKIEDYSELLTSFKVKHDRRDRKDSDFKLVHANFTVEGPVYGSVNFVGDVENARIDLIMRNLEKPGAVKHALKKEQLNEEFLDRLAKYLIRESDDFLKLEIDDSAKEQIRKFLEDAEKQREQELKEAEERLKAEEEAEKNKPGRFDGLLNKIKPKK